MQLSKSGDTYVLKCHCGCYNLSFSDHGVQLTGRVTCLICGAASDWGDLVADCAPKTPCAAPAARVSLP